MGVILSRLYHYRDRKVLLLGLSNAGKSTLLQHLLKYPRKARAAAYVPPTPNFSMQRLTFKGHRYAFWDMSGARNIRAYWRCYYTNSNGVMYVIDASDAEVAGENVDVLSKLAGERELQMLPFLIFLNKFDKRPQTDRLVREIERVMANRRYKICRCTVEDVSTVYAGFAWLAYEMH